MSLLYAEATARARRGDDSLTAAAILTDTPDRPPSVSATLLDTNTRRTLGNSVHCPPINAAVLDTYIEYLMSTGFLPKPAAGQEEAEAG